MHPRPTSSGWIRRCSSAAHWLVPPHSIPQIQPRTAAPLDLSPVLHDPPPRLHALLSLLKPNILLGTICACADVLGMRCVQAE